MLDRRNEKEAEMKKKLIVVDRNACIVNQVIRNLRRAFTPSREERTFCFHPQTFAPSLSGRWGDASGGRRTERE